MTLPDRVRIVEVGPRDGLQNESIVISVEEKVAFIELLADAGLKTIEVGSFVSQALVPQMASTAEVLARLRRREGVRYPVLVPNVRGLEAALKSNVREIAVFAAATESFSRSNLNCSIAESLDRYAKVVREAARHDVASRGYVSCVLGCPFEGNVAAESVASVAKSLSEIGCYEISLGDTIGVGTPLQARRMLEAVAKELPMERLAVHFHDTYGQALANIFACIEIGVSIIDSSASGLGGCPFAPGAAGNVATEDVVYMLDGMGIHTGVDLARLLSAVDFISARFGHSPASRVARAYGRRRRVIASPDLTKSSR
jgi:hydroxymethylglutaryl-CoA lyase